MYHLEWYMYHVYALTARATRPQALIDSLTTEMNVGFIPPTNRLLRET